MFHMSDIMFYMFVVKCSAIYFYPKAFSFPFTLSVYPRKIPLFLPQNQEQIQPPDILSMNCMFHAQTTEIFSKVLRKHCPQKEPNFSKLPLQLLHNLYSQKQALDVKMILVIVDELDYLITQDRTMLQDLFMLTTLPFSRCILLGIANAIDLADRFMPKLQCLNCKPAVITFRSYSKDQIIMILKDRLNALPYTVFQPQAVELCAGRVAAASGDMRKALSICRSAIRMLEAEIRESISNESLSSTGKNDDQLKSADFDWLTNQVNNLVRIDHVAAALSKTFKSPAVDTIQSLPQHQQIVLCSTVKLFRSGKKDTAVGELNRFYRDVCKSTSIPPVSIMELSSMCRVLDDQKIHGRLHEFMSTNLFSGNHQTRTITRRKQKTSSIKSKFSRHCFCFAGSSFLSQLSAVNVQEA